MEKRITKKIEGGLHLVKKGVQIAIWPTWAFQILPPKAVASGGSNLARLGELGGKLLPYFSINRGRSEEEKGSAFLAFSYSLKFAEENCFHEENPSRGASVTFP